MEASRAATGMLDVLATRVVRFMMPTSLPFTSIVSSGNSFSTFSVNGHGSDTRRQCFCYRLEQISTRMGSRSMPAAKCDRKTLV